jgi:hypothetical protein
MLSGWACSALGAWRVRPVGVERLLTEIIFKELVDSVAATGKTTLASIRHHQTELAVASSMTANASADAQLVRAIGTVS